MLKVVNAALVIGLIVSAFVLYSLEHSFRKHERQVTALKREIGQEGENIKLLKAEWSYLIRPERLQRLADAHLQLRQSQPYQLVKRKDLAELMALRPAVEPADGQGDLIGDMLKAME